MIDTQLEAVQDAAIYWRCKECGFWDDFCPEHGGMCVQCCAATKRYIVNANREDALRDMNCNCGERKPNPNAPMPGQLALQI